MRCRLAAPCPASSPLLYLPYYPQIDISVFVDMPEANETTKGSVPNYAGLMTWLHDHMSKGGKSAAVMGWWGGGARHTTGGAAAANLPALPQCRCAHTKGRT